MKEKIIEIVFLMAMCTLGLFFWAYAMRYIVLLIT